MKMNSLTGLLQRAEANITVAQQALEAKDPYEAGEVFDELSTIASDLRLQEIFVAMSPGRDPEESRLINAKLDQILEIQIKLETMVDQLGEDYDYKGLLDGGE